MKWYERFNTRALIASLLALLAGLATCILGSSSVPCISIGSSLIASAVFSLANTFLVEDRQPSDADIWKLDKIYTTRASKSQDSDPKIASLKKRLDGIAFGLTTFRSRHSDKVEACLQNGVAVRLLVMDPDSPFLAQRENEEEAGEGHIKKSINSLVDWANTLKMKGYSGSIEVKGYSCMTLDFYWRMDDELYFGPYWYGKPSQATVTYRYKRGGEGFDLYSKYFEDLWHNGKLCRTLTRT